MIDPFEYTKQANPVLSLLQVVVAVVARLACVCVLSVGRKAMKNNKGGNKQE
jgi:hypothetical protein